LKNSPYLIQLGNVWYARIRWPKETWGTLGSGMFKKSLRTDSRDVALTLLPAAMQEFQNRVAAAKQRQMESAPRPLGEGEITLLVAQWYRAVAPAFRADPRPKQLDATQREARRKFMDSAAEGVEHKRRQLGEADYMTLTPIVDGLLSRAGLNVDREDPSFGLLCQTLMRAWIALDETALAQLRGDFGFTAPDPILKDLAATTADAPAREPTRTLDSLIDAYTTAKQDRWSQSTQNAYKPVFRVLRDTLGRNRDVRSVSREDGRAVFEVVKGLPTNLAKRRELAELPVPAAVEAAKALGLPTISPKTINDGYMTFASSIFGWAEAERWVTFNPFVNLTVWDDTPSSEKRNAFTDDQLKLIFGNAPWSTGDTSPSGKPSLYWGPLIALYHGMRIGEPCGMLTGEVTERDGVPVFNLKPNELRRLKNDATRRWLPIHPELIRLGFLDYVRERRRAGDQQLFPEARRDANGHYGDHVTDWFARLLDKHGLADAKLTLHSLRHTFEDKLRAAELDETTIGRVLAGRRRGNDPTAAGYGNGHQMHQLLTSGVEKLNFTAVALPVPGSARAA
jgi:integrase